MAKQLEKTPKPEESKEPTGDLNSLIESGQGANASDDSGASALPPPIPAAGGKKSTGVLPFAEQPKRSGDACPRPGCKGHLGVMSTHKTETHRIRYLACNSCKLVGGKEVTPL